MAVQLDVICALDGVDLDTLVSGSIGIDSTPELATATAIDEWVTQYGVPISAAVSGDTAPTATRPLVTFQVGEFQVFAGPAGVRGTGPESWKGAGPGPAFQSQLIQALETQSDTVFPTRKTPFHALTLTLVLGQPQGFHGEARADGAVSGKALDAARGVVWPPSAEPYMFKQYYVLVDSTQQRE